MHKVIPERRVTVGSKLKTSVSVLAVVLVMASCASDADTLATPSVAAPPGKARADSASVRHNQEPPAAADVAVLARGEGPGGNEVALVAYKSKGGATCWGWSESIPGQASLCFGPRGGPEKKALYLMHQTFGGGEPPRPLQQFVYGAGPAETVTFRFEVEGASPVSQPAQTSKEPEGNGQPHFMYAANAPKAVTVIALDANGEELDRGTAKVDEGPSPNG